MIGAFICGGLGNQMFQYAAGRALAMRHKTGLQLDLSAFGGGHFETVRRFELHKLAIEVERSSLITPVRFKLARRASSALQNLSGWTVTRENSLGSYDPSFAVWPNGTYLYGYWQSWRYFAPIADRIRAELQPRVPLSPKSQTLKDRMQSANSLSLHVRRGDYLTSKVINQFHGVLDRAFYENAVRHVQERTMNLQVYVFSDDLVWCRKAFAAAGLPLTFVDANRGDDSWQDLFLMAACRHNIIANSSFSWWGAWLGDDAKGDDRIVIAPRNWFAGSGIEPADRFPPAWTVL